MTSTKKRRRAKPAPYTVDIPWSLAFHWKGSEWSMAEYVCEEFGLKLGMTAEYFYEDELDPYEITRTKVTYFIEGFDVAFHSEALFHRLVRRIMRRHKTEAMAGVINRPDDPPPEPEPPEPEAA